MPVPTPILEAILENDGFWPDVEGRAFVEGYRLQSDVKEAWLTTVLTQAMIDTNDALAAAKAQAIADGYATLAAWSTAHPAEVLNGQQVAELLYLAAVFNLGKAKTIKANQAQQRRPPNESETTASGDLNTHFLDEHQNAVYRLYARLAPTVPATSNSGVYCTLL